MKPILHVIYNGAMVHEPDIPEADPDLFTRVLNSLTNNSWRVVSYFGIPEKTDTVLYCILACTVRAQLGILKTRVTDSRFPSLAETCPQIQLFEREIAEQYGVRFTGHPWLKPVRFHQPFNEHQDDHPNPRIGVTDFYRVEGESVHEVAVGPVHAGIIEPGHFRFQCHGEHVFHLEISLGYQHRGIEAALVGGPHPQTLRQIEALAGDTTLGHGTAYCMVMEALGGARVSAASEVIRGIALELERLANHTGDLGAIAGDVGYLPTASYCGRIRGDFLNMTALICGSRFGRGLLAPGGTVFSLSPDQRDTLIRRLETVGSELENAVNLLWHRQSVMGRLEGTGIVSSGMAEELGLVGPAARASGLKRDVRHDYPFGIYRMAHIPMATGFHGDVCARAVIRWQEIRKSMEFIIDQLRHLPSGPHSVKVPTPAGNTLVVALTEGWRGEICHVGITDENGRFKRYKITDPSFHNWQGLAMAMRGQQISDFPLCNKSFNLSYCGYDG